MSVCQYWNCSKKIKYGYFLCSEHYEALKDKLIDKCPQCGRYKDSEFNLCLECLKKRPSLSKNKIQAPHISKKAYKLEHSKAWERKDKEVDKFFVYILKGNNAILCGTDTRPTCKTF